MNTHMTTHDLLEMASLDAMGLLDPEEREAFERAFRAAAPAVQAQIRREQLRFSQIDDVLPQIDPPLGLKARVIAAVRDAMQSVASRRAAEAAPALRNPYSVSRFWRVGAVGAMAACLVLGFYTIQVTNLTREQADANSTIAFNTMLQETMGRRFGTQFMHPDTRFVNFVAASDAPDSRVAHARLVTNPKTKISELFVQDLPASGGDYEVLVVDAQGRTTTAIITFAAPTAGIKPVTLPALNVEVGQELLIRLQGTTKALLKSQGL